MRYIWTVAPDQERVQLVTENGDEDAELRPTIDFIVTFADPADFDQPERDEADSAVDAGPVTQSPS
ncbi:MAG TPA: hypothetical protein PK593_02190 [Thermomicrobiales bacterium]|jgi:hypothetical protein|nr:hypothetical protein [Chloroflexota bacterium]HQX62250.1 hypothetical protein [Thermomicrobiales bacterium]HBY46954.1 hypothetical protein [Chloroflexota bacterium]HCG29970.1 hypothetical protein [Chloroflexota bacterium]HQZ91150.1 hypothetical protein [Thermomicrobiales bacterium]